jgi:hypothetical protein
MWTNVPMYNQLWATSYISHDSKPIIGMGLLTPTTDLSAAVDVYGEWVDAAGEYMKYASPQCYRGAFG